MVSPIQWTEFEQTLGGSEGQRKLACCSLWDCKESDTTECITVVLKSWSASVPSASVCNWDQPGLCLLTGVAKSSSKHSKQAELGKGLFWWLGIIQV